MSHSAAADSKAAPPAIPRAELERVRRPAGAPACAYAHRIYAESFAEFGEPIELPRSGGWLLKRPIGDSGLFDAMGCYPMFACRDWSRLAEDLDALRDDLVSVSLVADPYGDYDEAQLGRTFDLARPFKDHFLIDIRADDKVTISPHHMRHLKKARKALRIEKVLNPAAWLDEWASLYGELVTRHNLRGIKAFSRQCFARMLETPGMFLLRVLNETECVGGMLVLVDAPVAYFHLMGVTDDGYRRGASYRLIWGAVEAVREGWGDSVDVVHLGAGAGASDGQDGLSQFKRGWTPLHRPAYLCGRVFHPNRYAELCAARNITQQDYFPAYRRGELL